jgi:hypothetical protein
MMSNRNALARNAIPQSQRPQSQRPQYPWEEWTPDMGSDPRQSTPEENIEELRRRGMPMQGPQNMPGRATGMRKSDASAINPHGSLIGDEGQPNPSAGLLAPTVGARDQLAMMSRRDQQGSGIGGGGHMMAPSASQPPTQETLNELWRRQPTDQNGVMIEHIIRQSGGRLRAPWDDEPQAPPGMMRGLMDPTGNR